MDASRLLNLLQILEGDANGGYFQALQELQGLFGRVQGAPSQNLGRVQGAPNQNLYPQIDAARTRLFERVAASAVNSLVPSYRLILRLIGGEGLFGHAAGIAVLDILERAGLAGPHAVAAGLGEYFQRLQNFRAGAQNAINGLTALGVKPATLGADEYEFGLTLPEEVSKSELPILEEFLEEWDLTLKTFLELAGDTAPVVRLRGVASGSPLQIFAHLPTQLSATMLAVAVERLAKLYKNILEIRLLRGQLKDRGVRIAEVEDIGKQEKEMLEAELESLRQQLMEEGIAKGGRKAELGNQLAVVLRTMAHYMNVGVDEEVSFPPLETDRGETAPPDPTLAPDQIQAQRDAKIVARRAEAVRGASMAELPRRDRPVLQLVKPERPAPPDEKGMKAGERKK